MADRLGSWTVGELLEATSSSQPTPGGGSASCLAGALGAGLLAMALRISQKKAARDLARPTEAALQLQASLLACADRDRQAFSAYLAASKLPGPERGPALRAAALGAAQVPLQAARQMTLALWVARQSAGLIHPAVSSDAEGAKYLLAGAGRAVLCNVEINLGPLDQQIAAQLRSEQQRLGDLIERLGR